MALCVFSEVGSGGGWLVREGTGNCGVGWVQSFLGVSGLALRAPAYLADARALHRPCVCTRRR